MSLIDEINSIIKTHPKYDSYKERAIKEVERIADIDSLSDGDPLKSYLIVKHKKITSNEETIGNTNDTNSIVAYLMGITTKVPDKDFNLEKRRAYGRSGFPDIDMDFDYLRRSEVIDYFRSKYGGEDYVAHIGTIQTLQVKAALRRVIKVLDPTNSIKFDNEGKEIKNENNENFALENQILKTLPRIMKNRNTGDLIRTVKEAYEYFTKPIYRDQRSFREWMDEYPRVYEVASRIEGIISSTGVHAAGLVASPVPLSTLCPLHTTGGKGSSKDIATQFTADFVEALGLIKFDFLGLKTKTAINWASQWINDSYGVNIDWNSIDLDDKPTLNLLNSGETDGCFQFEEEGMQAAAREIGIDSFEDIVITVAMFRPGPMDYIPELSARKRGKVKIVYPHESMRQITKKTYGILCFQEQIMRVFMAMSGLTATDGYKFTKGCAKKKKHLIEQYKEMFIKGCTKNNISESISAKIWADMQKFGGYAFNKSLHFSEKITTSENDISIQDLYNIKQRGEELPQVFSPTGEAIDIVDVYDHGVLPVYETIFDDGSSVCSTMNHKFMTNRGILSLQQILEENLDVIQNVGMVNEKRDMQSVQSSIKNSSRIAESSEAMHPIPGNKVPSQDLWRGCENNWREIRVKSVRFTGLEQCYDLEVDSPDHLYCLSSGIVNSNSHSVSYAFEAYKTAYLKAHYPTEFFAARLSVETFDRKFEKVDKYLLDAKKFGFKVLPPHVNESKLMWSIVGDKTLRQPILLKDVGPKVAEAIVEGQPYAGNDLLYSFVRKVGDSINSRAMEAMYDAGLWDELGLKKDELLSKFEQIKKDKKRGDTGMDIFD